MLAYTYFTVHRCVGSLYHVVITCVVKCVILDHVGIVLKMDYVTVLVGRQVSFA